MTIEKGSGWVWLLVGWTSVQVNYLRPDWAKAAKMPLLDVRRNVPTADWRRRYQSGE